MLKQLIAGVTAASLALASPAQAGGLDREDVGKLLIGLAAIAALNAAIENHGSKARPGLPTRAHDRSRHNIPDAQRGDAGRWADLGRQTNRRVIPHDCLRRVETRFGTQRMFGRRCLERNYTYVDSLPNRCAVRVYTSNGPRRGFDPLCLREQGYRTDRRR